jgi:hypothetical protein
MKRHKKDTKSKTRPAFITDPRTKPGFTWRLKCSGILRDKLNLEYLESWDVARSLHEAHGGDLTPEESAQEEYYARAADCHGDSTNH